MNQLLNSTAAAPTASGASLPNDTRFEDLRKEFRAQGALVKKANNANEKAIDSLPNMASIIVRGSRSGTIDLVANPEAITILYSDYCEAIDKDKPYKASKSDGGQVSKLTAFHYLGAQQAFNGEDAFDLVTRLFDGAKKEERAAKDKRKKEGKEKTTAVPGPYESKYNAYLEAARVINNNASANPPRFPRLDANNTDTTWQPNELPDHEIVAAMELSKASTKDAAAVLKKIVEALDALIKGTKKDREGAPIKDNDKSVVDAYAALKQHMTGLQMKNEANDIIAQAMKLGVSMAELQVALSPRATAGRKRNQRRG